MRDGVILDVDDVKEIIAEKFSVDVKNVIKSQYSYTVITASGKDGDKHDGN